MRCYVVKELLLLITILVVSIPPLSSLVSMGQSSSEELLPIFNATRRVIPDNLPWYPILVFGDNRPGDTKSAAYNPVFYRIVEEFDTILPIAVIGTGDYVGLGYEYQYLEFYRVLNSTRLENLWLAVGNHDVEVSEGWDNWAKYIGPTNYYIDDIPGWRIGIVNTEVRLTKHWENQLKLMYENLSNRSLLLAFHKPVFPDVDHNIRSDWIPVTLNTFSSYGYPKVVLRGHWHGWGYSIRYNVTWIVTGGAGAPLYTYEVTKPEEGDIVTGVYHYTVLILYPNGTFRFYPVDIGSGKFSVKKLDDTSYLVVNSRVNLRGEPVEIPVRVKFTYNGVEVYTVLMAPPRSSVEVSYSTIDGVHIAISCNATEWYVYVCNPVDPNISHVSLPVNGTATIDLSVVLGSTTPTMASKETVSTGYTPTRSSPAIEESTQVEKPKSTPTLKSSPLHPTSPTPIPHRTTELPSTLQKPWVAPETDFKPFLRVLCGVLLALGLGTAIWLFSRKT